LLDELEFRKLTKEFDFSGFHPYTKMLRDQIAGKNNSWAIRWYASAFLKNKLTLYPGKSLVHNIGLDGSGTHCGNSGGASDDNVKNNKVKVDAIEICENYDIRLIVINFFKNRNSVLVKGLRYLKAIYKYAFKN
jgi:hypothetical protein